ncbi:uncharacterized protein NPIL_258461 [Nephila pilipes]|uniref:Uncharacterized protein n=1 Tax=Nephila pilipes TaxID=299642 RepID=A0A8X6NC35_NEPPI|nr:uncharacterized protein NPIL_258461 [Nephila pilipes]
MIISGDIYQVPKLGYYANYSREEILSALLEIYTHDFNTDDAQYWSWEKPLFQNARNSYRKMKRTFTYDYERRFYKTCYSTNLHIYGNEEVETSYSDESIGTDQSVHDLIVYMRDEDTMFPWTVPRIFFSVHSPFVPNDPFEEGVKLEKNHDYLINIKMEEEHLLESPYPTNCTDYEELWEKNNKTGPRSQEMCKEWCLRSYFKPCHVCWKVLTMLEEPTQICQKIEICYKDINLIHTLNDCQRNCNLNCKKLIYRYEIVDRVIDLFSNTTQEFESYKDQIRIKIVIKNPEVIVMSHKPLYTAMDIFSYVGGLMGCWLGISVWAFTEITETTFSTFLRFLKQYLKNSDHSSPTRNQLSFSRNHHNSMVSKYSNRVEKKLLKKKPEILLK